MSRTIPEFHRFDEVGSTNDVALEMAKAGCPHGTVVTAKSQAAGKGRLGRRWWDKPGESALMSILLHWPEGLKTAHRCAFVASIGAAEGIEEACGLQVKLKWPNDLMVGGRKVGGILAEVSIVDQQTAVVAGIGINVLQSEFPPDIPGVASSLFLESGAGCQIDILAEKIAKSVLQECDAYHEQGFSGILNRWRRRMHGVGRQAEVVLGESTIAGTILGLDDEGRLLLRGTDNEVFTMAAADRVRVLQ